ncbi:hypothetical protein GEOBRER4_n1376 [Citrifermentans bremense]|uniref:Uncharacterized protein n=1 Tax=Citrifermentans bremense TaxID=60035 RepID=A0A7R7FS15_9BACT|nr:hypothetical protein GEOBRER4_n1376 [Citrifermentans bremense]
MHNQIVCAQIFGIATYVKYNVILYFCNKKVAPQSSRQQNVVFM